MDNFHPLDGLLNVDHRSGIFATTNNTIINKFYNNNTNAKIPNLSENSDCIIKIHYNRLKFIKMALNIFLYQKINNDAIYVNQKR